MSFRYDEVVEEVISWIDGFQVLAHTRDAVLVVKRRTPSKLADDTLQHYVEVALLEEVSSE